MFKKIWHWLHCKLGWHVTYSIAEDMDFKFDSLDLSGMSTEEHVEEFIRLTSLRCRHCDYIFGGRLKKWIA